MEGRTRTQLRTQKLKSKACKRGGEKTGKHHYRTRHVCNHSASIGSPAGRYHVPCHMVPSDTWQESAREAPKSSRPALARSQLHYSSSRRPPSAGDACTRTPAPRRTTATPPKTGIRNHLRCKWFQVREAHLASHGGTLVGVNAKRLPQPMVLASEARHEVPDLCAQLQRLQRHKRYEETTDPALAVACSLDRHTPQQGSVFNWGSVRNTPMTTGVGASHCPSLDCTAELAVLSCTP